LPSILCLHAHFQKPFVRRAAVLLDSKFAVWGAFCGTRKVAGLSQLDRDIIESMSKDGLSYSFSEAVLPKIFQALD
jgi:hypothetical protein